jgi:hypothetical protein
MKRKTFLALALVFCINFLIASEGAYAGGKIYQFDLFGFDFPKLRSGSASALSSALEKKFGKAIFKDKVKMNMPGGICILAGSKKYELYWRESETEGFDFIAEQTDEDSSCPAGIYKEWCTDAYCNENHLGKITFPDDKFFPVSGHNPEIKFGVSTSDDIIRSFGRPYSKSKDKLVYALKRDRQKEKFCDTGLQAVTIEFEFKNKVLNRIYMGNHIHGEC